MNLDNKKKKVGKKRKNENTGYDFRADKSIRDKIKAFANEIKLVRLKKILEVVGKNNKKLYKKREQIIKKQIDGIAKDNGLENQSEQDVISNLLNVEEDEPFALVVLVWKFYSVFNSCVKDVDSDFSQKSNQVNAVVHILELNAMLDVLTDPDTKTIFFSPTTNDNIDENEVQGLFEKYDGIFRERLQAYEEGVSKDKAPHELLKISPERLKTGLKVLDKFYRSYILEINDTAAVTTPEDQEIVDEREAEGNVEQSSGNLRTETQPMNNIRSQIMNVQERINKRLKKNNLEIDPWVTYIDPKLFPVEIKTEEMLNDIKMFNKLNKKYKKIKQVENQAGTSYGYASVNQQNSGEKKKKNINTQQKGLERLISKENKLREILGIDSLEKIPKNYKAWKSKKNKQKAGPPEKTKASENKDFSELQKVRKEIEEAMQDEMYFFREHEVYLRKKLGLDDFDKVPKDVTSLDKSKRKTIHQKYLTELQKLWKEIKRYEKGKKNLEANLEANLEENLEEPPQQQMGGEVP
jgi:hypothetical protein